MWLLALTLVPRPVIPTDVSAALGHPPSPVPAPCVFGWLKSGPLHPKPVWLGCFPPPRPLLWPEKPHFLISFLNKK